LRSNSELGGRTTSGSKGSCIIRLRTRHSCATVGPWVDGDARRDGETVSEIELLIKIKNHLGQARELAAEGGGLPLFYFIEMAIMETDALTKKATRTKLLTYVDEPDGEQVRGRKLRRLAGRLEAAS
jgi:hypothetical protein